MVKHQTLKLWALQHAKCNAQHAALSLEDDRTHGPLIVPLSISLVFSYSRLRVLAQVISWLKTQLLLGLTVEIKHEHRCEFCQAHTLEQRLLLMLEPEKI